MRKLCLLPALALCLCACRAAPSPAAELRVGVYRNPFVGAVLLPAPVYAQPTTAAYTPAPAVYLVPAYPRLHPFAYYYGTTSYYYPVPVVPPAPPADGTPPPPLAPQPLARPALSDAELSAEVARLTRLLNEQNASPEARVRRLEKRIQALEKNKAQALEVKPGGGD